MPVYQVVSPIRMDGRKCQRDDFIELDADTAERLLELGDVAAVAVASGEAPAGPPAITIGLRPGALPSAAEIAKFNKAALLKQAQLEGVTVASDGTNKQIAATILAARGDTA